MDKRKPSAISILIILTAIVFAACTLAYLKVFQMASINASVDFYSLLSTMYSGMMGALMVLFVSLITISNLNRQSNLQKRLAWLPFIDVYEVSESLPAEHRWLLDPDGHSASSAIMNKRLAFKNIGAGLATNVSLGSINLGNFSSHQDKINFFGIPLLDSTDSLHLRIKFFDLEKREYYQNLIITVKNKETLETTVEVSPPELISLK